MRPRPEAIDRLLEFARELRRSWRRLRRRPGTTLAVVLLLSLGLGGVVTGLAVAHSVYLDPLPYPEGRRLVFLRETSPQMGPLSVNYSNFLDWRARNRSFAALAALRSKAVTLGGDEPLRLDADLASSNLFTLLGVEPSLGRGFTPAEEKPGVPAVAVLGHGLWRERFGGDPSVLGRVIALDGQPVTVVGVMPAGFDPLRRGKDLWLASGPFADRWTGRTDHEGHWVLGRLAPGISLEAARRDLERLGAELEAEHPAANDGIRPQLEPLARVVVGDLRSTAAIFLGAVLLILVVTVANVAGLLLAESAARQENLRVRLALGATRRDLAREHAVEGLLLGLVGVAGAVWVAQVLQGLLQRLDALAPVPTVDWLNPLVLGGAGIALALAIALLAVVPSAGDLPAIASSAPGRAPAGVRLGPVARRILVVGEVAMAFLALVAAGLLWRSLHELHAVRPGFEPELALTFELADPAPGDADRTEGYRTLWELEKRLEAAPEIAAAGFSQALPLTGDLWKTNFDLDGEPRSLEYALVSPGYFRAMGIALLDGRRFTARDRAGTPWVAVIDRVLAERFWPDGRAVGGALGTGPGGPTIEVVGIVESVRSRSLASDAPGLVYVPYAQSPTSPETTSFVVRGRGELSSIHDVARSAAAEILPGRPIHDLKPLRELVERDLSAVRNRSLLAGGAAGLATALAMIGLYGSVSFAARRRTREIGIRMVLGSSPGRVAASVLRDAVRLATMGFFLGVPGAWMLARLLKGTLYGVAADDLVTYAGTLAALLVLTLVAALLPAVRAARIDPRRVLVNE